MVLATVVVIAVLMKVERILVWLVVAAFLATALWPVVGLVQRRTRMPRSLAVLTVFVVVGLLLAGVAALFVTPLVTQGREFYSNLPDYVAQARQGRGPVGELVTRFHLDTYVRNNSAKLRSSATGLGSSAGHVLGVVASTLAALVSIVVLTFLMLLEGPKLLDGVLSAVGQPRRARVERVGRDCAKAVTGYMAGNLFISVVCGVLTFVTLAVLGVPFAGVIALFVAIADLIPLVGATIGAVAATAVAFLHSVPAGIGVIVFFVLYQQLENHLLQPLVLSRTVKINALAVLVSILVGVELAGILGALLAIPVAGMVQVLVRDVYDHRRGVVKDVPTVGEDEVPVHADDHPYPDEPTGSSAVEGPAHVATRPS
jgi:predicted PurR-regulated permease PerM